MHAKLQTLKENTYICKQHTHTLDSTVFSAVCITHGAPYNVFIVFTYVIFLFTINIRKPHYILKLMPNHLHAYIFFTLPLIFLIQFLLIS